MISAFEFYHGAALRSVILACESALTIEELDTAGRANSFLLNREVAIHIKHAAKRLPPWNFSLTLEHLKELLALAERAKEVWILFVCGQDGIAAVSLKELVEITDARPGGIASIRIDRDRRQMYRVFGNAGRLPTLKARGVAVIAVAVGAAVAKCSRKETHGQGFSDSL